MGGVLGTEDDEDGEPFKSVWDESDDNQQPDGPVVREGTEVLARTNGGSNSRAPAAGTSTSMGAQRQSRATSEQETSSSSPQGQTTVEEVNATGKKKKKKSKSGETGSSAPKAPVENGQGPNTSTENGGPRPSDSTENGPRPSTSTENGLKPTQNGPNQNGLMSKTSRNDQPAAKAKVPTENGRLPNGHAVNIAASSSQQTKKKPGPFIPEEDERIMNEVAGCIERGVKQRADGNLEAATETFQSGVRLCERATLQSEEGLKAVKSCHGRLLVDLSFMRKGDVLYAVELMERAMRATDHIHPNIIPHFTACIQHLAQQLEGDKRFMLQNQRRLRKFAEDRLKMAEENMKIFGDYLAAINYLHVALVVLKTMHSRNMATNWQLGQVYLQSAEARFQLHMKHDLLDMVLQEAEKDIKEALDYTDMSPDSLHLAARIAWEFRKTGKARYYANEALKSHADPEMMMIVAMCQCTDDDDQTEVGSDYSYETASVTTCASSMREDIDTDWIHNHGMEKKKPSKAGKKTSDGRTNGGAQPKKKKLKMKTIRRRGRAPDEPAVYNSVNTEAETRVMPAPDLDRDSRKKLRGAAEPSTSKASMPSAKKASSKPAIPSPTREVRASSVSDSSQRQPRSAKPSPQKAAVKLLTALSTKYEVMLTCKECFPLEAERPLQDVVHECKESVLVVQEIGTTKCQRVRAIPPHPNMDKLCENFKNDIPCDEREKCPRPHTEEERITWILSKEFHCSVTTFIEQLKTTSLKCSIVVRQLCLENNGVFVLNCSMCLKGSPAKYSKKKSHSPFCEEIVHPWDRPALVFQTSASSEMPQKHYEICSRGKSQNKRIDDIIQRLFEEGFRIEDVIQESQKVKQAKKAVKPKDETLKARVAKLSESRDRGTSESSDEVNTDDMNSNITEMIGEIPCVGDVDSPTQLPGENDQRSQWPYYPEISLEELSESLKKHPGLFKLCTIQLEGPHDALCLTCDPQDAIREIKICGRMNCGAAMDGDTVVVEIVNSEVLDADGNATVLRGRVQGVMTFGFNREAYTFVCTIDQYSSNLMKPVCGTAPKVHVLDHDVKNKFPNNKKLQQANVAIYKETDRGVVCQDVVKLNLKNKHDRLYIVKYLRWGHGFIYPLGYVCAVIPAGTDIQQGVDILNLTYQVPSPIPEDEMTRESDVAVDVEKRQDLRNMHTMSIDPPGCQDVDDALSVTKIKSKGESKLSKYKVTVHIADVSERVRKDDKNDVEAKRRMTSYYPGGDRSPVHMLPRYLSQDRCSLKADEDRLALSLSVIIQDDGSWDIKTLTICESLIRNNANMTYRNAQDIIENNPSAADFDDKTKMSVTMLYRLAYKLREKRLGDGQHLCDLEESLEEDGCAEAHNLVAEFMILANKAVAQYLMSNYQDEVPLRHQGKPADAKLSEWNGINSKVQDVSLYFQQFRELIEEMNVRVRQAQAPAIVQEKNATKDAAISSGKCFGRVAKPPVLTKTDDKTAASKHTPTAGSSSMKHRDKIVNLAAKLTLPPKTEVQTHASCDQYTGSTDTGKKKCEVSGIPIAKSTVQEMELAFSNSNDQRARHLFSTEMLHPMHAIAMSEWFMTQERACYIHSGDPKFEDKGHYSLQADKYVQFTSPIRRYLDIVIHRLVKAKLRQEDCPYSGREMYELCVRANRITARARQYDRAMKRLEVTAELKKGALFLPAAARTIDDCGIGVCLPFLRTMKSSEKMLRYSDMDVTEKPLLQENDHVELHFMKRIYDNNPNTRLARTKQQSMVQSKLNPSSHVCHVTESDWGELQKAVRERPQDFREKVEEILTPLLMKDSPPSTVSDISSEMRGDKPIIRHHANFGFHVERAGVVQVQLSTRNLQGLMAPMISLMNLTPNLDICLEHSKEPIACFAELATKFTKEAYHSLEEYQEVWKPLISMESAQAAAQDGEPIVILNVPISMHKANDDFYGSLKLSKRFCFDRHIKMMRNSKGDDEDSNDYLCLRIPMAKNGKMGIQHRCHNVWLAHAVASFVSETDDDSVKLEFKLQHFSSPPPADLLTSRLAGDVRKPVIGTVEILPKPLPFRRMEEAVDELPNATDLCRNIVLGPRRKLVEVDELMKKVLPTNLNIEARSTEMTIRGRDVNVDMPPNNTKQNEAMTKALTQTFTVIQGPPGTGKTLTGVKLVYHFVEMNRKLSQQATNSTTKRQVLYCGPSNSAVDVAARFLFERLGDKCPKIVRVYSENLEKYEFPIPRESLNIKAKHRKFELLGKEMHKHIALHHLVRKEGKDGNRLAKDIKAFDALFARNKNTPEEVSNDQVEEYHKLLKEACMAEIKKYDVILATCSASPSNRISRGANVTQCIIDECGMCQEPESLIPLVAFKPKQVVLIGDHKQLRPIITNQVVKDLGMEHSLFERHAENAIMLDRQYRMHPAICKFPSLHFYEDKLTTERTRQWADEYLPIWPAEYKPVVFCHVAGAEKVLNVATADGSEQSKSNQAEVDHSVRIFLELVNRYNVNPKKACVLSQYKAQCAEITRQLKARGIENPNVSTVVASQGGEWHYVILSTVRSLPDYEIDKRPSLGWLKRHLGFITDHHQINVALTRAQRGMIIVGNSHLLACDRMWNKLLQNYRYRNLVMPAWDFPLDVKAYNDRETQRAENALDRYHRVAPEDRGEFIQQERDELKQWLDKQADYNPYADQ